MKDLEVLHPERFQDPARYVRVDGGIYGEIDGEGKISTYALAMSFTLESGEDGQYPLEDVLDKYFLHVEDFLDSPSESTLRLVLGEDLHGLQQVQALVGRRVYNEEYTDADGTQRIRLAIG